MNANERETHFTLRGHYYMIMNCALCLCSCLNRIVLISARRALYGMFSALPYRDSSQIKWVLLLFTSEGPDLIVSNSAVFYSDQRLDCGHQKSFSEATEDAVIDLDAVEPGVKGKVRFTPQTTAALQNLFHLFQFITNIFSPTLRQCRTQNFCLTRMPWATAVAALMSSHGILGHNVFWVQHVVSSLRLAQREVSEEDTSRLMIFFVCLFIHLLTLNLAIWFNYFILSDNCKGRS